MAADLPHGRRGWLQHTAGRLRRTLDPEAAQDRESVRTLVREIREWRARGEELARDHVGRTAALEKKLEDLAGEVSSQGRQVARVRNLFARQRQLLARLVRRSSEDQRATELEHRVTERLARIAASRLPIVVGPWTGEVGFELLYWIPFLQWAREAFALEADRLVVISRGGVAPWYGHVCGRYEDIFTHATPEQFQAATAERKKQQRIRPFDRHVIRRVLRARGIRRVHLLHPTLMYTLFNSFWRYAATVKRLEAFSRFRTLPPVDAALTADLSLPDRFTAVRFYFSDCFPDTPDNRRFAARVVEGLAQRGHVVLLNNDLTVDDHYDFAPEHRPRVHALSAGMRPDTNLAVQTAAISRAAAFVGTYGGYSYLAPLYGVSSVAFYSRSTFKQHHLELAHRAFLRLGAARLVPVDVSRAEMLGDALSGVVSSAVGA